MRNDEKLSPEQIRLRKKLGVFLLKRSGERKNKAIRDLLDKAQEDGKRKSEGTD